MDRPSFIDYRRYRYLKAAALLLLVAVAVYAVAAAGGSGAYGGSVLGYVYGVFSAGGVVVLAWYGIRKRRAPVMRDRRVADRRRLIEDGEPAAADRRRQERRFGRSLLRRNQAGTLQGWLSLHVYFGLAILVVAALHAGFRFGLNLPTLAYVLLVLVAASGCYGAIVYIHLPRRITENLGEDSLRDLLAQIRQLDELARVRALGLTDVINALVLEARTGTRIGGNLLQQIVGAPADCPTDRAVHRVQALGRELIDGEQPRLMRDLYVVLLQKQRLVRRARTDIRLNARLRVWLIVHTPLTLALLAAVLAHVVSILVFW